MFSQIIGANYARFKSHTVFMPAYLIYNKRIMKTNLDSKER